MSSLSSSATFAQAGAYVWSDQFENGGAGELELESYSDFITPGFDGANHYLNQTVEIEYGATRDFSFGISQTIGRGYRQDVLVIGQFGLEGLYRFESPDGLLINPVLSIEYSRMWHSSASNRIETKLILSKDLGRFSGILNGAFEYRFGDESEVEPEFSAGICYRFTEKFRGAAEIFSAGSDSYRVPNPDLRGTGAGPTLSFSVPGLTIASGVSFGLTGGTDKLNFRTKVGIDL